MKINAQHRLIVSDWQPYPEYQRGNAPDIFRIIKSALGISKAVSVAPRNFNGYPGFIAFSESSAQSLASKVQSALESKGFSPIKTRFKYCTSITVQYEDKYGDAYSVSCMLFPSDLDETGNIIGDNTIIHVQKGLV